MTPLIDLHLHTTASDGRCSPEELVHAARARGIEAISVTDHDTRAGEETARAVARGLGMGFVSGIEITSVYQGRDVHVLAYALPERVPALDALLHQQRQARVGRAREIASRLERLGAPVDMEPLAEAAAKGGRGLARPQIAERLVAAGHVRTIAEAFERYLGEHCPAYVPHTGASPATVVSLVVASGGVASLAHPGYTNRDELIPALADVGLGCLEVFHSSHDLAATARYAELARRLGLAATGGSDYHGEGTRRAEFFGVTSLPAQEFEAFLARVAAARVGSDALENSPGFVWSRR